MKAQALLAALIIGGTFAASFVLGPTPSPSGEVLAESVSLPFTGPAAAVMRVRHGVELDALATPVDVYDQYVAPAVTPTPTAAPRPATAARPSAQRPYSPPAGTVTINVPIYRQIYALDCETGALQMGLAYYGHYYSQSALFADENPDLRAAVVASNGTVLQWGDPYTNFVGNVNGSEPRHTGYGVYYPVILSIARSHGLPNAYGGEGFSASTIYAELTAHHPVEVWIEAQWSRPWLGTWTAWDGRRIRYSNAEHAVTLTGVSPTSVRVNDPEFGSQYWVSKATFETVWRDFDNMAVVFR
ncbi:MAG TPA: C39 family peptidase [Candidatus Dormibacteraeota bacterium]